MLMPTRSRRGNRTRLHVEPLEQRDLLAAGWPGLSQPPAEAEPNDTLDRALDLGDLSASGRGAAAGVIGDGPAAAADVDWYRFTLARPANVNLATLAPRGGTPLEAVLSLFNTDLNDFGDFYDPAGHRLLAQDVSTQGGPAAL